MTKKWIENQMGYLQNFWEEFMEYERISSANGQNELWTYEWDLKSKPPMKVNRVRLGVEQPPSPAVPNFSAGEAIAWSYGRTVGNIATSNNAVIRNYPASSGHNAVLPCEIVEAGKYQNGNPRWWCRTHQKHWGTKADTADAIKVSAMRCAQHTQLMWYVVNPYHIDLDQHAEVGIWCSLPAAMTSQGIPQPRYPRIHVHVRSQTGEPKILDRDFDAIALLFNPAHQLYCNSPISRVHLAPPAAMEFVLALEYGKAMTCFNCYDCGSPHLDLGEFVNTPHKKHLCGNCGRVNTWTTLPSTSTPLKPLHDFYVGNVGFSDVSRVLDIDAYPNAEFAVWASTPALVWTANRPQERGIHVHLRQNKIRIVDDTFGTVIYKGQPLNRTDLLTRMIRNTLFN